jgi:hypothetical protein
MARVCFRLRLLALVFPPQEPGVTISYLNIWKFTMPVPGAALSWLLIPGERPIVFAVAGMVLTASAVVAFNLKRRRSGDKGTN